MHRLRCCLSSGHFPLKKNLLINRPTLGKPLRKHFSDRKENIETNFPTIDDSVLPKSTKGVSPFGSPKHLLSIGARQKFEECISNGASDELLDLLIKATQKRLKVHFVLYYSLYNYYMAAIEPEKCEVILGLMEKRNAPIEFKHRQSLAHNFAMTGKLEKARQYTEALKTIYGIVEDNYMSYLHIAKQYYFQKSYDDAMNLTDAVQSSVPSAKETCDEMRILIWLAQDKRDKIYEVLLGKMKTPEAKQQNEVFIRASLNSLLYHSYKNDDHDKFWADFNFFSQQDIPADKFTCRILMQYFIGKDKHTEAVRIFDVLLGRGVVMDVLAYQLLFKAFKYLPTRQHEIFGRFTEMLKSGMKPTPLTCKLALEMVKNPRQLASIRNLISSLQLEIEE